jgi:hypothetical protein
VSSEPYCHENTRQLQVPIRRFLPKRRNKLSLLLIRIQKFEK